MKKLFILAITLTGLSTFLNAQNSFPTNNAIWNETHDRNPGAYIERLWGLFGDTIINDTFYNKLYVFSDTILSERNIINYIGGFRNEGEKVWFKPIYWEYQDILLYDFSAEVGDTVWHNGAIYEDEFNFCSYCYSIVGEIKTRDNKKIYQITNSYHPHPIEWIEGIGCANGLFMAISSLLMFQNPSEFNLNCFKHNDVVEYLNNPSCNKCFCLQVGINENSYSELIHIFPNPASNQLKIKSEELRIERIAVFDIFGKKILETAKTSFDISHLPVGVYILQIETETGIITKRIMKQ